MKELFDELRLLICGLLFNCILLIVPKNEEGLYIVEGIHNLGIKLCNYRKGAE